MDKKLLDSLNNLSLALEHISLALKDKREESSGTAKAIKGGDFVKEIKEIHIGIKSLQKDSKQILSNQQTIMKMGRGAGKKESVVEDLGKDKKSQKNFKEGIGVILLIAVAVLAIGVAFKLVGKVNFLSVIALSLALPLLAIGFSKVHKVLKEVGFDPKKDAINFIIAITAISIGIATSSYILSMVSPLSFSKFFSAISIALAFAMLAPSIYKFLFAFKDMSWGQLVKSILGFVLILPAIALGIAFASWAFQLIKPIGFSQFLTAVGIGIVFAIISFGIRKLLKSFKGIGVKDLMEAVIFLPLILPAIALGIAGASYAFQFIKPIGFMQFLTAVGIAIVFAVIAFGIRKLLKSFQGLDPATMIVAALMLPVILVALSYAIAYSSVALGKIKPISFSQFLTAIGIAAVFVVISYGVKQIVNGISLMKWTDVPKIPVFFVLIAIAITASSYILAMIKPIPIGKLLSMVLYAVALSIAGAAIGGLMGLLSKMKVGIKDALMGTLLIVVIAAAIMISSHILALGNYKKYPDWKWALGVGLAILAFAPGVVLLGLLAMADGGLSQLLGAVMVLIVATAIMATSHILAMGNYKKSPPILWTLGVLAVMVPFAIGMVALGMIAVTGIGAIALLLGAGMILVVALTINETAKILNKGKFDKYPPILWTLGVLAVMVPFAAGMVALGAIAATGIGAIALLLGAGMILVVALTINETAKILNKGTYGNFPSLAWTLSVGLSMTGFGVAMLALGTIIVASLGLGYLALEAGSSAVLLIAETIVSAGAILSKGNFKGGPTADWALGVAIAMGAFAPIYGMLMSSAIFDLFGGGGVSPQDFADAIVTVCDGIVTAAKYFAENTSAFVGGPSKAWAEGIGIAIGAFAPVYKVLQDNTGMFASGVSPTDMKKAIMTISQGIVDAAKFFAENTSPFSEGNYPSKKWGEGVGAALGAFAPVFKALSEDTGWFTDGSEVVDNMLYGIKSITRALVNSGTAFAKAGSVWGSYPSDKWADGVKSTIVGFLDIFSIIGERGYSVSSFQMYSAILNGAISNIASSAKSLWMSQNYFKFKLDKSWVKNVGENVLPYALITQQLDKMLGFDEKTAIKSGGFLGSSIGQKTTTTTTRKMKDVSIINRIISQIIESAIILTAGQKYFKFKLDKSWVMDLSKSVIGYAAITQQLDKMLGFDEKTSIKSGGFLGLVPSTTNTTTRQMKDVSIVNRVVSQIIDTARILHINQNFFKFKLDKNWVYDLHWNLENYAKLAKKLEKILTIADISKISLGVFGQYSITTTKTADIGIVNKVVNQLIMTASILHKNKNVFGFKIDPNYMDNISTNVLTFADLANKLAKKQKGQSVMDEVLGIDPISRAARGMVKIADAYTTLAKAVKSFSGAINSLNVGKLNAFRVLTGNLAMLSALDSNMFSNMLSVLESRSGVFANMLQMQTAEISRRPQVNVGGGAGAGGGAKDKNSAQPKDGKGETQLQKLDKVIYLLKKISNEAQGINEHLHDPTGANNSDVGSKGDG